jgi:hypothetical protein
LRRKLQNFDPASYRFAGAISVFHLIEADVPAGSELPA